MVEALVKRVKHVGNEKEASEGASNDAVVASLGRTVGGHARVGASESDSPGKKKKTSWRGTAQQKLRLSAADFVIGDVTWRPVTWEGWKSTDRRRQRGDL